MRNIKFLLFALMTFSCLQAFSQNKYIYGNIIDGETSLPLSDVGVFFEKGRGTHTDDNGNFKLNLPKSAVKSNLSIELTGYINQKVAIDPNIDTINLGELILIHNKENLDGVTVTDKKKKYRNKNNPAVELIRQVIAHKEENQMTNYQYASYDKYEKMVASISNMSDKLKDKKFFKKYEFLLNNVDTTKFPGIGLLPLYLEELSSKNYYQKSPEKNRQIITGQNKVDFGEFIDTKGVTTYLKRLYEEVNIYDNNISLFTNQFLSPIAGAAPTFYRFYIRDTSEVDGIKVVKLYFTPRNPQDMLFRGTLFVTLDGHYAIQKVSMFAPPASNINFLRELKINLNFEKQADGRYLLSTSDLIGDFSVTKKGAGLFGERLVSYKDFKIGIPIPDSILKEQQVVILPNALNRDSSFWIANRFDTLTRAESLTYSNIDSLVKMPSFKRTMDYVTLFVAGYKQSFHNKFEIGPASTFYSFNPVEGFRLRFGGRTTPNLSKRLYMETYGAYGFKDKKFKYFGSFTYSINDKSIYTFPQHYIRASFQRDTKIPGQELQFVQEDNFLLSFKRGNNDKWLYNDLARIDYVKEFENHFSIASDFKYWKQTPAGTIAYVMPTGGVPNGRDSIQNIRTSEIGVTLRYAPHEAFYQGKLYRVPIINQYPIISLSYIAGIKGLFGGQYSYNNFDLNVYKRFYFSQLGYSDVVFDAGYTGGKLPFPLLFVHHANQAYTYQFESYNMMNFLEFVSDHYASLNVDHFFNGFIFNKIPLFKKLKWREVIEGKILYGGVRNENNPAKNPDQMYFPTTNGAISTFVLDKKPYAEGGFGIANIFKILRVDYIWRFTYLDHPGIPKSGVRFFMKFDF
ncbi:DUF5686 family protein [Rhizosphaericola mali]|uniref:DUF5686 family protein n=1 Tax=Rhizosphaericola mali TaxID=2545455 RepID=UPI001CDA121E|nr:DUF5686 family protein [Rhizosphaericola mali]